MPVPFQIFYASGARGQEVRADGKGGTLPRGYYFIDLEGERHGPFKGIPTAVRVRERIGRPGLIP